jgi:endonuclease/exonuclease/phosphatase family metal-dependent hydrolase
VQLRVLTWNIHKGIGGLDRRYQLDRIVRLIAELEPDVALLQEVAEGWPAANFEMQAEELRDALGFPHMVFGSEHRFKKGGYGNTILSRFPIHDVLHVDLTVGWRKKRGALIARVHPRIDGHSRTVAFANLHLGLAGSERGTQLSSFMQSEPIKSLHRRTPLVVAGDLNDLWGTLGPRFLVPEGLSRAGPLANTFPASLPVRPLDGIFVRGDLEVGACRVIRSKLALTASDHRPLLADLRATEL